MITKPRGTVDIYDKKMREYVALKMIIRNIMDLYNYDEIETPIFESNDLFSRAVGTETDIVAKEMFVFEDKKGRKMALRPEGTAPTVRMVLENKLYTPDNLPLKMFYLGQMFRYERPQNGRQRQFNQLGVEVFGTDNYLTDVEVISLAVAILKQIGIDEVACHINYLVSGPEREKYITNLKKELQALTLCDDCQKRLTNNPLRVLDCKVDADKFGKITHMQDFLTPENDAKFKHIIKSLEQIGTKCVIDPLLVRGLDYYTGVVFEIKAKDNAIGAQSTILGGGRYNKLVEELGGVALPAIGFGVGLERVLLTLEANNISLTNPKTVEAFILTIGDKTKNSATLVSSILRAAGISCEINHLDKNIKSAFKVAERINAKNILLIGEEELKNNVITIKNQVTKIEEKIAFDKLLDYFNVEQ